MKKIFGFMSLLAGMFLLSSCSNDDDPVSPDSETPIWYRGYFEGEVDGVPVSIRDRESSDKLIGVSGYEYWSDPLKGCGGTSIGIKYDEKYMLHVDLYRPMTGVYYFTNHSRMLDMEHRDGVYIGEAYPSSLDNRIYYDPIPEHPFRVEIINAHYEDLMPPLIEAEFSGTLYRKDNPNDSIVVKGKFSHIIW